MGINVSRYVNIHISNKTRNFTLKDRKIHFFSGHILDHPPQEVSPGSTVTCKFTNNTLFWGCNGVLAYQAESFTLAIYFSNPIDYNRFFPEMGLELSLGEVQHQDLKVTYERLVKISKNPSDTTSGPHQDILREGEEQAQVRNGPLKVTATMNRGRSTTIKVVVEEQRGSGQEAEIDALRLRRHVQEKWEPERPSGAPHG